MTIGELVSKQLDRIDFKHIIALAIVAYVFHIFELVLFERLPEGADTYASQIITGLLAIITMVLAYWFSASATKKESKIDKVAIDVTQTNDSTPK